MKRAALAVMVLVAVGGLIAFIQMDLPHRWSAVEPAASTHSEGPGRDELAQAPNSGTMPAFATAIHSLSLGFCGLCRLV